MNRNDFTKTSFQVNDEIASLIGEVQNALDVSQGELDRKGQAIFSVVLSVVLCACIFVFSSLIKHSVPPSAAQVLETTLAQRDRDQLEAYLGRLEQQIEVIQLTKNRVAPSLPIDPQLSSVRDAVEDVRRLFQIQKRSEAASSGQ